MGELDRVLNRLDVIGETVGRTEAQVGAVSKSLDEMRLTTKEQEDKIQSLDRFRSKIIATVTI